jgi:hypothetical protein
LRFRGRAGSSREWRDGSALACRAHTLAILLTLATIRLGPGTSLAFTRSPPMCPIPWR